MKFSKSLLCLALALSLLAGCAGAFAEESGFPLVSEPITFTAFTAWVEHMSDPATNTMNVTYEEMTGVHIDWIQSQDYITDLNLMIAGELLPLNDLIDEYAPNLKAALEEHPEFREYLTAPDGNIYTFFTTDCGLHMPNRRKMFVKKDWLNAYRESVGDETAPNTVEEFEEMLVFFRDSDLNGNGAQDEIPLIGSTNVEDEPLYYLILPHRRRPDRVRGQQRRLARRPEMDRAPEQRRPVLRRGNLCAGSRPIACAGQRFRPCELRSRRHSHILGRPVCGFLRAELDGL